MPSNTPAGEPKEFWNAILRDVRLENLTIKPSYSSLEDEWIKWEALVPTNDTIQNVTMEGGVLRGLIPSPNQEELIQDLKDLLHRCIPYLDTVIVGDEDDGYIAEAREMRQLKKSIKEALGIE